MGRKPQFVHRIRERVCDGRLSRGTGELQRVEGELCMEHPQA